MHGCFGGLSQDKNTLCFTVTKLRDYVKLISQYLNNFGCWTVANTQINKFWRMSM